MQRDLGGINRCKLALHGLAAYLINVL